MLARRTMIGVCFLFFCAAIVVNAQMNKSDEPTTQPGAAPDLSGTWTWTVEFGGNDVEFTLKLKQDGDRLTGTLSGFGDQQSEIEDGTVKPDGTFSFKTTRDFNGTKSVTTYTGRREGNSIKGKSETVFTRDFDAKRSQG